jgi:hypothetical protein
VSAASFYQRVKIQRRRIVPALTLPPFSPSMMATEPFPQQVDLDHALARIQFDNAEASLRGAEWAALQGMPNNALHSIAITFELALKSYLLNVATSDDWNRIHIRHDLDKAITYAERAGLTLPVGLRELSTVLHPHFQRGGFQRNPSRQWPEALAANACRIASALLVEVSEQTGPRPERSASEATPTPHS